MILWHNSCNAFRPALEKKVLIFSAQETWSEAIQTYKKKEAIQAFTKKEEKKIIWVDHQQDRTQADPK